MTRTSVHSPLILAGPLLAVWAASTVAAAEKDACYLFQLAAVDSLGRIIHDNSTLGDAGPRIVQASSAMQLLEAANCDVEVAFKGMNCLMNKILPYKGGYALEVAQACLDQIVKAE